MLHETPPRLPTRPARKSLIKVGERESRRLPSAARIKSRPGATPAIANQWRASADGSGNRESAAFQIPKFGITVLGNSHGFDPAGSTSGFVLWVNGQGVMVDPPPHSTALLLDAGIPPNSITAIILTHCHADHDAGTFQKMITENKVTLMTTSTIFESFKRKYAAVSGLKPEFIQQLVSFRPMFLEEPNYWNGASLRFFYSLHSIPCVGFQVSFGGKDIVYSGDTFYDPPALRRMHEDGTLSAARLKALLDFPWHCDIVLHEAGVPPIHTPIEALADLPKACKKNIHLIHIDKRAASRAEKFGFRIAKAGVENTMVLIPRGEDQQMLKFLQLVSSMEIFRHFKVAQALDLMLMSREASYPKGALILRKGTTYDRFMIILQGRASVQFEDVKKFFRAGDYLGELAAWSEGAPDSAKADEAGADPRVKETVLAETDVKVMEIDKYALNYLLMKDPALRSRLETMIHARVDGSWEAISSNSRLRLLSSMQKTELQALLVTRRLSRGDIVWARGDPVSIAVLISRGELVFEEVHGPVLREISAKAKALLEGGPADEERVTARLRARSTAAKGGRRLTVGDPDWALPDVDEEALHEFSDHDLEGQDPSQVDEGEATSVAGADAALGDEDAHAPLSTGMLIFDYYGFHNRRALTTTLVCKSAGASIFVLESKAMLHFLDRNPMILLALLKSPILY